MGRHDCGYDNCAALSFSGRDFIKIKTTAEFSYDLLVNTASIVVSALGIAFTYGHLEKYSLEAG